MKSKKKLSKLKSLVLPDQKKPCLKDKHTAIEAEKYAKAFAIYEAEFASYVETAKSVEEYNDRLHEMFEEFLAEELGLTKFSEEKQKLIWDFRYNSCSSCESLVHKYEQIFEIIDFIHKISDMEVV